MKWHSDDELFGIVQRELFTAVVGDVMDQIGMNDQFLPPNIQPLSQSMVAVGRAMTVLEADVFSPEEAVGNRNSLIEKPFGLMLEALDDLKRNEIYICTGASPSYALWGELMSIRALKLGAVGAIVDGFARDTAKILSMGFPVFSQGRYAQDQKPRGKVLDFRVPLKIGNVVVRSGDIVFGDIDGVCVVPRAVEVEVFTKAIEKAREEKRVKKAIEDGMSTVDAFAKFGIM